MNPKPNPNPEPEPEPTPMPNPNPTKAHCDSAKTLTVQKTFEQTLPSGASDFCDWGNSGNGAPSPEIIQARVITSQDVTSVPQGAELCEISVTSKDSQVTYTDGMYLLLNGLVIATDRAQQMSGLPLHEVTKTRKFEWYSLQGQSYDLGTENYCAGADSRCHWPNYQVWDLSQLSLDSKKLVEIANSTSHRLSFQFVSIGDDDEGSDCQHSKFSLDIQIKYIEP